MAITQVEKMKKQISCSAGDVSKVACLVLTRAEETVALGKASVRRCARKEGTCWGPRPISSGKREAVARGLADGFSVHADRNKFDSTVPKGSPAFCGLASDLSLHHRH